MTFEAYKTTIWEKEHPVISLFNEEIDAEAELDIYCLQRIDWIEHCIKSDCANEINKSIVYDVLESLITYFEMNAANVSKGQLCFAAPGGLLQSLFEICKDSLSISKEEREKMDDLLLNRMIDVFKKIDEEKSIPFDTLLWKILSWFNYRQSFCNKVQIGFSPSEYYIPANFYSTFREDLLALRNIDFEATAKFAEYSIWVYNNAKNVARQYMIGDILKFNKFAIQCSRNALVAAQCNGYFECIDSIKSKIRSIQSDLVSTPTVFISYQWGKQALVDEIQKSISRFVIVKRDVNELEFGDNITEFMNTIREEDFALIIISDAYLKSEACMYELTTLFKDQGADNFKKKVLFLICDDAHLIYTADGRGTYAEFWDNKYKELVARENQLTPETSVEIAQNIRTVSYIRLQIGEFLKYIKAVNNFGEKDAIQTISTFIEKSNSDGKIGRNAVDDFFIMMRAHTATIEEETVEEQHKD